MTTICMLNGLNSFTNEKVLDLSKLKALADGKIDVAQKLKSVYERVENTVGIGQKAGYQHCVLFPQCFQKSFFLGVVSWDCVVKG